MEGLGKRMRELRNRQGLTIAQITEKTGIDKATLSRIENGKMRGPVSVHMKIAQALGVRLPDLYEDVLSAHRPQEEKKTREKIETFSHSSGAVAQLLTSGALQKKMMPLLLRIKKNGRTETEEYPVGTERFVYVTQGKLLLIAGSDSHLMKKGDSLYFNGARPHHFENPASQDTVCLSVLTPVSL